MGSGASKPTPPPPEELRPPPASAQPPFQRRPSGVAPPPSLDPPRQRPLHGPLHGPRPAADAAAAPHRRASLPRAVQRRASAEQRSQSNPRRPEPSDAAPAAEARRSPEAPRPQRAPTATPPPCAQPSPGPRSILVRRGSDGLASTTASAHSSDTDGGRPPPRPRASASTAEAALDLHAELRRLQVAWAHDAISPDGQLAAAKADLARRLAAGPVLEAGTAELAEAATAAMDRVVGEGGASAANVELLRALLLQLDPGSFGVAAAAARNGWAEGAAKAGDAEVLALLLTADAAGGEDHTVAAVAEAFRGRDRIPIARTLLQPNVAAALRRYRHALAPLWQELFETVALRSEALPGEGDVERAALLDGVLGLRDAAVDFGREAEDRHTILSRAAARGDTDLVGFLTERRLVDPGAPLSDGTTPLIEAVLAGHTAVVALLAAHPAVDPSYSLPEHGTVLDIARREGASAEIIGILAAAAQERSHEAPRRVHDGVLSSC